MVDHSQFQTSIGHKKGSGFQVNNVTFDWKYMETKNKNEEGEEKITKKM